MATKFFATRNDIPEAKRGKLIDILNAQLVDLLDLQLQTKFAHWNVKGPQFMPLHELFDKFVADLGPEIDDTAERAVALGGKALGTARQVAKGTRVEEFPLATVDGLAVVKALADRYATVAKSTREAINEADEQGDKDTADLFTGTSRMLDKALWFLEAHVQ